MVKGGDMLIVSTVFFGIAALLGLIMLALVFQGKNVPLTAASCHGGLSIVGVTLLWVAAYNGGYEGILVWSLGLFILAALGGTWLLYGFQLKNRKLPLGIILTHGFIAVVAFVILLVAVITPLSLTGEIFP